MHAWLWWVTENANVCDIELVMQGMDGNEHIMIHIDSPYMISYLLACNSNIWHKIPKSDPFNIIS